MFGGTRKIISVAARAFIEKSSTTGGNPVTVFLIPNLASSDALVREKLAKSCRWESVCVVQNYDDDEISAPPKLFFYMPTGEEVSFCAHAAMGAASVINKQLSDGTGNEFDKILFTTAMCERGNIHTAKLCTDNIVELRMENYLEEMNVDHSVMKSLLHQIGLDMEEDVDDRKETDWPYLNSSVARHKTLVPIKCLEKLHSASSPRDPDIFRDLCDSIESTGVYLYCRNLSSPSHDASEQVYECRQFPRASYPEDPATGIAAAALASSLRRSQVVQDANSFVVYQGTAMGLPSRINVRVSHDELYCSGAVQIDSLRYIDI